MKPQALLDHPQWLPLAGAEVCLWPAALAGLDGGRMLETLQEAMDWQQREIELFGRRVLQPRLVAFHGEPGVRYRYSNRTLDAQPWSPPLRRVREAVRELTGHEFNSVLGNWYRDGSDSMGWHADDETQLGSRPVIVSVSFGASRRFLLRRRDRHSERHALALGEGDVLLMQGQTQALWQHAVAKTARPTTARINLTFRQILADPVA